VPDFILKVYVTSLNTVIRNGTKARFMSSRDHPSISQSSA
jgi:hypothetical protein